MTTIHPKRRARPVLWAIAALASICTLSIGSGAPSAAADVPAADRKYTVRVHQLRALDETGPFNVGLSDEIYAGFATTYFGVTTNARSALLGDFDAGETRTLRADQNCLLPVQVKVNNGDKHILSGLERDTWTCNPTGFPAPFEIRAVLWERDSPEPCLLCSFDPAPLELYPGLNPLNSDDDRVGDSRTSFSVGGLAADFPSVGGVRDYTVEHRGSGGHYRLTYRVTRTG